MSVRHLQRASAWTSVVGPQLAADAFDTASRVAASLREISAPQPPPEGAQTPTPGDVPWRDPSLAGGHAELGAARARDARRRRSTRGAACALLRARAQTPCGGFATYSAADSIDVFIHASGTDAIGGWLAPHPCVTSVALQALLRQGEPRESAVITRAREYLLATRDARGRWLSYWWNGPAYNTFFALEALEMAGGVEPSPVPMTEWLPREETQGVEPSRNAGVFATALDVLIVLLCSGVHARRAAKPALELLLACQRADGGWPSRPILRIPSPNDAAPREHASWRTDATLGSGVIAADPRNVFTSATALMALMRYRAQCCRPA